MLRLLLKRSLRYAYPVVLFYRCRHLEPRLKELTEAVYAGTLKLNERSKAAMLAMPGTRRVMGKTARCSRRPASFAMVAGPR